MYGIQFILIPNASPLEFGWVRRVHAGNHIRNRHAEQLFTQKYIVLAHAVIPDNFSILICYDDGERDDLHALTAAQSQVIA